jgi:hypothetical protein
MADSRRDSAYCGTTGDESSLELAASLSRARTGSEGKNPVCPRPVEGDTGSSGPSSSASAGALAGVLATASGCADGSLSEIGPETPSVAIGIFMTVGSGISGRLAKKDLPSLTFLTGDSVASSADTKPSSRL